MRSSVPALVLAVAALSCGDDSAQEGAPVAEIAFHGQSAMFPGLELDTGLQPEGSPVQASFQLTAVGDVVIDATAVASGSEDDPTLTGLPGGGRIAIDGAFALVGTLKVDIDGLPSYEGPIPGIENVAIVAAGEADLEPFAIGDGVAARADIPSERLPGIPLPGGIPGQLVFEVAEGSFVETTFSGVCAGIDGREATYTGTIERAGTLVLRPLIEIEVPLVGTQTFTIPDLAVDLALGSSDVAMAADVVTFERSAPDGDQRPGSCGGDGAGGGGAGGADGATTSSASSTGGTSTTTSATSSSTGGGPATFGVTTSLAIDGADLVFVGPTDTFDDTLAEEGFHRIKSLEFVDSQVEGRSIRISLAAPEGVGEGCPGETRLEVTYLVEDAENQLDRVYWGEGEGCGLAITELTSTRWAGSFYGLAFDPTGSEPEGALVDFTFVIERE